MMDRRYVIQRDGKDFALYAGLLDLAHERGLLSIETVLVQLPTEANGNIAVVQATVRLSDAQGVLRSFQGIGDAAPGNVNRMMAPHLLRLAETRAKARALRDAVNVGEALADDPSDEGREPSSATYASANANAAKAASAANAAYAESPRTEAREQRRAPGAERTRPGPEASPRQWFDYLAALARDHGIAVPPTPGPGVDNDEIVAQNSRLKAAIQAKQQTRQGGR
jgi:hypothetical protein